MKNDLVCLAHLRWAFTFQRPNHLMARFANERRTFYVEEPVHDSPTLGMTVVEQQRNLFVCTPRLPSASGAHHELTLNGLLRRFLAEHGVTAPTFWLYTPMMLPWLSGLPRKALVYDCMDELSMFLHAPPELLSREDALLRQADLVFTGGQSLYAAKRAKHPRVFAFPSSVDVEHFRVGSGAPEPEDQRSIPHPRIGFFGVIDERMDLELLQHVARERPQYQFVMLGPVVKISPESLPRAKNIHYLGAKPYAELPRYAAGWDVAMMPFALNDATRFISPTKTLEYLAAKKPVVSTAIRDVVRPYADLGVVRIADMRDFSRAIDEALQTRTPEQLAKAAAVLRSTSWDATWSRMNTLLSEIESDEQIRHKEELCSTT